MEIVEVNTEEFNKMAFDRREIQTKHDKKLLVESVIAWAERHGADVVYKYKRKMGYLWMVEEK